MGMILREVHTGASARRANGPPAEAELEAVCGLLVWPTPPMIQLVAEEPGSPGAVLGSVLVCLPGMED